MRDSKFMIFKERYVLLGNKILGNPRCRKRNIFISAEEGVFTSASKLCKNYEVDENKTTLLKKAAPLEHLKHDEYYTFADAIIVRGSTTLASCKRLKRCLINKRRLRGNPPLMPEEVAERRKADKGYIDWRMIEWELLK